MLQSYKPQLPNVLFYSYETLNEKLQNNLDLLLVSKHLNEMDCMSF